jgi:hypothetical protein
MKKILFFVALALGFALVFPCKSQPKSDDKAF